MPYIENVNALDEVKGILYNQYSRCTWCNQMDALHADVDAHDRTKWMLYMRCIYRCTWTNDLVHFRVQMDALLTEL